MGSNGGVSMIDFLVSFTTVTSLKSRLAAWMTKDEDNRDAFRLPTWCDALPVDAYTDLGTPAVMDGEVEKVPAVEPTKAAGRWVIVSLDREVKVPPALGQYIKAQGRREDGLDLPKGIAGLSTVWAGMTVRPGA